MKSSTEVSTTDEDLAKYLLRNLDIKYHSKRELLYLYDVETCLWKPYKSHSILKTHFTSILDVLFDTIIDRDERSEKQSLIRESRKQNSILSSLSCHVLALDDDEFIENNFDMMLGFFPIADNKVVNLKTNIVIDRKKEHYFTKTTQRTHLSSPDYEFVRGYLKEVLCTNSESYVDYVLGSIGYSLTGENSLKRLFILQGPKDTGKSLFIKLLQEISGCFGMIANDRVFKKSKNESCHDEDTFSLLGSRIAFISEMDESNSFNETLMKKISGNDGVTLRHCAGVNKSVLLNSVMWLATNTIPKFSDEAFQERLRRIEFKRVFENNAGKKAEVLDKVDDFFTICIEFSEKFYNNDCLIEDVQEVISSTEQLIDSADSIKMFWNDQDIFEITGEAPGVCYNQNCSKKSDIYFNYCEWVQAAGKFKIEGKKPFYSKTEQIYLNELREYKKLFWSGIVKIKEEILSITDNLPTDETHKRYHIKNII